MFFDQNMPLRHFQSESIYISHITYVHEENLLIFLGYEKDGFAENRGKSKIFFWICDHSKKSEDQ